MTTDEVKKATIERCARLAHEANRLWCLLLGDESQATWEHAEPWQKDSALKGVVAALEGETPRRLHESWMAEKIAHGWVWGEKKDVSAKTHPCLKEYSRLPPEQKAKDHIFHLAVKVADAGPLSAWGIVKNAVVNAMVNDKDEHRDLFQAVLKALHESAWRSHWFYLQSFGNQVLNADDDVVSVGGTARAAARALAAHDFASRNPPRSIVEFGKAIKELLAIPEKAESPSYADQSKGLEALVAKMLPVVKNELHERGSSATCLPEDRHVAWALMKGLLEISEVLNMPKALMSQQDACTKVQTLRNSRINAPIAGLGAKTMGQIGYEAYAESTGGKTFDGRDMPTWEQIREREGDVPKVTRAWEAAAAKIAERCRDLK